MPVQQQSNNCPKAACSVSEMAGRCDLSRARFYELIKTGVMPPPCYDLQTRRPHYPAEMQQICLDVRRTNTALNGRYVIFNIKRTERIPAKPAAPKPAVVKSEGHAQMAELVEGLRALGIMAAERQIQTSLTACYPGGARDPVETVIRTVFRHLRRSNSA